MQYRIFQYPLPTDPELADLNAFLASQRVATVKQSIVETSGGPMLVFVVETASLVSASSGSSGGKSKIDYREALSESDFEIFSRLRDKRKELANAEGVPVYAIFSNAQLAELVKKKAMTKKQFAAVSGIGESRSEKYAAQLLPILEQAFGESGRDGDPTIAKKEPPESQT